MRDACRNILLLSDLCASERVTGIIFNICCVRNVGPTHLNQVRLLSSRHPIRSTLSRYFDCREPWNMPSDNFLLLWPGWPVLTCISWAILSPRLSIPLYSHGTYYR